MLACDARWLNSSDGQYPTSSPEPNSSHQLPDTTGAKRIFGLFLTRSISSPGTK